LAGTQQTIFNPNWPGASPSIVSQVLNDNELAGYTLQKLVLDLPASEIALNQAIPSTGTQLMSGSAWRNLIQTSVLTAGNDPNTGALFYTWDYAKILNAPTATVQASLDPNIIQNTLDPNLVNAGASDVYDYFRTKKLSPQKNTYWTGGSLGKIEFTGIYRSTADNSVYAPFRQNVELFVPAVPVVEVISPIPTIDASDVTTGVAGVTVQSLGATGKVYNNLYPGTSVFCEQGGTISINGYPSATPGVSSGGFGIYNYASYDFSKVIVPSGIITVQKSATTVLGSNTKFTTELVVGATLFDPQGNPIGQIGSIANDTQLSLAVASPLSVTTSSFRANLNVPIPNNANGFVDNQNGSMTLDPVKINNTYKDMLITYTYQENTSPAYGIGYLVIRVTPNPVPAFTIASALANPGSSIFSASCAGNPVLFDANSSTIGGAKSSPSNANYIANYTWDFGDPGSGSPNQPSLIAGTPGGPGATPTGHPQIPNQYVQSLAPQAQYFDMPVHIFTTSNTYTVNLSLTSNWRCPSTATATIINPATQASDLLYAGSSGAIKVGENPEPSFTMAKNCVGDQITFDASASKMPSSTSNSQIQNWNWNYNYQFAGNPYNANNLPNPVPATSSLAAATGSLTVYSQAGFYDVQLTTISTLGCQKSIDKPISQLAVTIPFNQYFDANDGGWQIVDLNTKNNPQGTYTPVPAGTTNPNVSWSWGNTTGRATNGYNSANALWSTSATKIPTNPPTIVNGQGSYYAGEASAIFSPCLNLDQTIVPRPMISYSGFVDVATGDGLVLQYSTDDYNILDPNKNWTILGTEGSGLDWYTSQALPSSPGTNAHNTTGLGWSGNGIDGNPPPTSTKHTWIHPKHALDAVATLAGTKKVILRFAFASTNSNTYNKDGVSIDSVFFGSRTRTILFENFTSTDAAGNNVLSGQIKSDNDYIRAFVQNNITSTQLVDINYHVGFVGQDPFNADNMSDPSARALYYGVKNIPYAFLDGHHHSGTGADSALFTTWGQAQYDLNTLKLAQADFNNSVTVNPDGSLKIDVNFTPLFDLPSGVGQTTLQIAVLEKSITTDPGYGKITTGETSFEYVLKKMLPNAIGTQFTTPIVGPTPGSTPSSPPVYHPISVGTFNYIPKNLHSNELTVVIFLQNETTKEVYQADLIDNLTVNNVVTGIEPTAENIKLYPNPADQELTIELPSPVKETTTLRLANQWGQFTEMSSFSEGEQKKTISTRDLAEGVYILQLDGNNNAVRAKVVVVHK
jgi:hypothetical protein